MKSIITIAILLLSLSLVSSAADVYKCASDLKLDTCYLEQESGTEMIALLPTMLTVAQRENPVRVLFILMHINV